MVRDGTYGARAYDALKSPDVYSIPRTTLVAQRTHTHPILGAETTTFFAHERLLLLG